MLVTDSLARCRRHFAAGRRLVVGIAGGSGSGKTTLAQHVIDVFGADQAGLLAQDSYYIDQSARFDGDGGSVNFDHPSSLDFELMERQLLTLLDGRDVEVPIYEFATHRRLARTEPFPARPLVVVDGTLILNAHLRQQFAVSVFVQTSEALRFDRRLHRDVKERGRTPEGVHKQFYKQVKPMHDQFVEPSAANATVRVSGEGRIEDEVSRVLEALEASLVA
jgi:uridine kinase